MSRPTAGCISQSPQSTCGWFDGGGTSLAAPLVAAFQAITGVDGSTPQWAYADAANLNDPSTGSTGACSGQLSVLATQAKHRKQAGHKLVV